MFHCKMFHCFTSTWQQKIYKKCCLKVFEKWIKSCLSEFVSAMTYDQELEKYKNDDCFQYNQSCAEAATGGVLFLKHFTKFTGKYLCQSPFFQKVSRLTPATLLKKRLWHSGFPVNFAKFLRALFLQNTTG